MFDLEDLKNLREDRNIDEERYVRDREMFLQGRQYYPTSPSESLSERDRGCYMMGYSMSELEASYV